MNESLMRLAAAAGIEGVYWDGLGMRRELQELTAANLLGALGFDPQGDADAQWRTLADAMFLTPLPPTRLLRLGEPATVEVALPQHQQDVEIPWLLALEDGEHRSGSFVPTDLTARETREINGGNYCRVSVALPDVLPAGYHRFSLPSFGYETTLIVAPACCYIPEPLALGGRVWGIAVQLYSLRSASNWGIGDFGDLAKLATAAGQAGAAFVGLNPLHARHLAHPEEASPYAPSSRIFLDPVYIDVEAVDGFAACEQVQSAIASNEFQARLAAARNEKLVDYAAVTTLKLTVLDGLFLHFKAQAENRDNSPGGNLEFHAFRNAGGEALARFAEFEAMRLHLRDSNSGHTNWHHWPAELRDPKGNALEAFRAEAADRIEFQIYLQWIAANQLQRAADAARSAGMSIGLYRDLAVGAASDSAETWAEQSLFAHDTSVGAPPDMLNRQGQNWGLPPWNPGALAIRGYAPFRQLLAANMRNAGALRIDHVMGLLRLFWIPRGMSGAEGGYVHNPFDELVAIVALESQRNRCMVIGEDLGSVPDGLRDRLRDRGFLSYRVLIYERHWQEDGRFCLPEEYPKQSLATVATHDMPTMTEYWLGEDIARRDGLGLYSDQNHREEEKARRAGERQGLLRLLAQLGIPPGDPSNAESVIASLHAAIARTSSMLTQVQLDDMTGEIEPVNIPGTYREYPNWRRKLGLTLEEILNDTRWSELAGTMRDAGRAEQ